MARGELSRVAAHTPRREGPAGGLDDYVIVPLDVQGRVAGWNPQAERVTGFASSEIIGRHIAVFYPPERVAAGYSDWELEQAARQGFWIDEGWRVRGDGTWFWAHVILTAQRSSAGQLEGFVAVSRDATTSAAREQRSSQRFSDLFDLAPAGLAIVDALQRLVDINPALATLLGTGRDELRGVPASALLNPDDQDEPLLLPGTREVGSASPWSLRRLRSATGGQVICEVSNAVSVRDDGTDLRMLVFHDITVHHRAQLAWHYQASHDELTGLLNRSGFSELLEAHLPDTRARAAVLFCDLDNFKRVNDSLGHHAGDELLVALTHHLHTELGSDCVPARFSGDEFLIFCPDVDIHGGVQALTAHVAAILHTALPVGQRLIHVSAAVGAALVHDGASTGQELLRYADVAMLDAKREGPGNIAVATPTLVHAATDQIHLETDLRAAIKHHGLALQYQPILDNHGQIPMAEALLRWPHPEHGLLGPDVILPVADRAGLTTELEHWVLATAMAEAATWPAPAGAAGPPDIAINITDTIASCPDFHTETLTTLHDQALDPHRLILEVTETSLVSQPERARQAITTLIDQGVRFAVDDFGTGYSSLARLKAFPTQLIKLDKQFVAGIATDPADYAICRTGIELATAMGRDCIAEGVETTTQHQLLTQLGYTHYQGFLISHPLPSPELHQLLTTPHRPSILSCR